VSALDFLLGFRSDMPSAGDPNDPMSQGWFPYGYRDVWGGFSGAAATGSYVRPDDVIGVSCVFMALSIWAGVVGTSPVKFYRKLPEDEGTKPLYDYSLARTLDVDGVANPWQTAVEWRMWAECQRRLWGLCISDIKFGANGLELWPIEAEWISQIEQIDSGHQRFTVTEPGKQSRQVMQDQVLYLKGFSTHKLIPESLLRRCRESVAGWLAQERHRNSYFKRGASPSIIFQHPGTMSDPALKRFKSQVLNRVGGSANSHTALVVEEGITTKEFGDHARNAQLPEIWDKQAEEVARWMLVHPYMLGVDVGLPYASRESAAREWLNLHVRACTTSTEASFKRDLISEKDVGCLIDVGYLTQGDSLAQAQVDAIYVNSGIRSEDEIRIERGWNPYGSGPPQRSVNQGKQGNDTGGDPRQPTPDNPGDQQHPGADRMMSDPMAEAMAPIRAVYPHHEPAGADLIHHVMSQLAAEKKKSAILAREHAVFLLARETEPIRRHAPQYASKPDDWSRYLTKHYQQHAVLMAQRLALTVAQTTVYADRHRDLILSGGIGVIDSWEENGIGISEMMDLGSEE